MSRLLGDCLEPSVYRNLTHMHRHFQAHPYHYPDQKCSVPNTLINRAVTQPHNFLICVKERRYQGRWNEVMLTNYC